MGANDADEGGAEETPIVVVDADPASRNLAEDLEDEFDRQVIAIDSTDFDTESSEEILNSTLVIISWDLGIRSGADLLEELRCNPRLSGKTLLVALERPTRTIVRQAMLLGADGICCKPYDADEIRERLETIEARRGSRAA
ncbi:MAG: response regulator transcription factor [Spirochaetaceae bacterium]|nr:response regulator transcription factor [Myxococcales bacterium]MCB9726586.1 response regulator transcription factor [Spirochaetaceae bacterium]HPG26561.1 hypothetical protein [Myxococcota bacterium]